MHAHGLLGELRPVVPDAKKIAVLRANGVGDYLFALPALESLRAAYPESEIVLLAAPWHARELSGRPGPVDRVEIVPAMLGIREPEVAEGRYANEAELGMFFARMQAQGFDLALQMHGGGAYSNPFVSRLGARVTAGLQAEDAPPLDRTIPYQYWQHEVLRFLELVGLTGAPPVTLTPRWHVTDADRTLAAKLLASLDGSPLVVLSPGAGDAKRRWPPANFAAVADALAEHGATPVISGSWQDRPLAAAISEITRGGVIDLCGRLTLGSLGAVMERASFLVGNDSGPLHIARAVGTPTVGLYWAGNLVTAGPLSTEWNRTLQSWRLACPHCGLSCMDERCECDASFVADIPVSDVINACLDLWSRSKQFLLRQQQ